MEKFILNQQEWYQNLRYKIVLNSQRVDNIQEPLMMMMMMMMTKKRNKLYLY